MLCSVFSMLFNFQLICLCLWWLNMDGFTAGFHGFLVFGILCKVRTSTKNLRRTDDSLSPATCKKQLEVKTALNTCEAATWSLNCFNWFNLSNFVNYLEHLFSPNPPASHPAISPSLWVSQPVLLCGRLGGWRGGRVRRTLPDSWKAIKLSKLKE